MAEDHDRARQDKVWKSPALKIFTAFKVALDPKKLLLAAAGILFTSLGWWFLSIVFYSMSGNPPLPNDYLQTKERDANVENYKSFRRDRLRWNFFHSLAGQRHRDLPKTDVGDLAVDFDEFTLATEWLEAQDHPEQLIKVEEKLQTRPDRGKRIREIAAEAKRAEEKPGGEFRTMPWAEDRGANQYLVVASLIKSSGMDDVAQRSALRARIAGDQTRASLLVLIEPLVKFLKPVVYFFDSGAGGFRNTVYLIAIILWTLLVWGLIGGAITRIAVVQIARNDKVGLTESIDFARARLASYFSAPLLPLICLAGLTVLLWLFGVFMLIPWVGELLAGVFWPLVLVAGLVMAVVMVGLVGWPLMNATISAEGSDNFDAISRSYSYVYQAPWHYIWYSFLALVYGAVLVFFVGFMGSLVVHLAKWGVTTSFWLDREPSYLFVNAPTSFGWRNLLLHDSPHAVGADSLDPRTPITLNEDFRNRMSFLNNVGSYLVTFWLGLFFLLIVGFSYSYFWTAATIIYLLMRHKIDDTDFDEIHLEDEESDLPFMPEKPGAPSPAPASSTPPGVTFTMVDAPQMKPPAAPPPQVPVVDQTPHNNPESRSASSSDPTPPDGR